MTELNFDNIDDDDDDDDDDGDDDDDDDEHRMTTENVTAYLSNITRYFVSVRKPTLSLCLLFSL